MKPSGSGFFFVGNSKISNSFSYYYRSVQPIFLLLLLLLRQFKHFVFLGCRFHLNYLICCYPFAHIIILKYFFVFLMFVGIVPPSFLSKSFVSFIDLFQILSSILCFIYFNSNFIISFLLLSLGLVCFSFF